LDKAVPEVHAPAERCRLLRHRTRTLHRAAPHGARSWPRQRPQRGRRAGRERAPHLSCCAAERRTAAGGRRGAAAVSAPALAHVLVVEDDPNLAAGVLENLRAEGYEVTLAGDGEQALSWLAAHSCALVILDVMLPGADGLTVCRTLRERGNTT